MSLGAEVSPSQTSPLERLLRNAYASAHSRSEPDFARDRHDFVFHIVEALPELIALTKLAAKPVATSEEAYRIVQAVLIHATGHLAGAARLDGGFIDPFRAGPRRPSRPRRKPAPKAKPRARSPRTS